MDSHIVYTLNNNNSCSFYTADIGSENNFARYYTYIIAKTNKLTSFFDKEECTVAQDHILKLNSEKMRLQTTDKQDGSMKLYLVRVSD